MPSISQQEPIALNRTHTPTSELTPTHGLNVFVAHNETLRTRAQQLVENVYRQKGYLRPGQSLPQPAHRIKETNKVIFIATDNEGHDAGTASLIFDSPIGLPCDAIFQGVLNPFRKRQRRLIEVTGLVINKKNRNSRLLLTRIINAISVFARHVRPADDFIIEINPHHARFYERLLLFKKISNQRPCPRVGGAPALLMRLDLHLQPNAILQAQQAGNGPKPRTIYRDFYLPEQEVALAASLPDPWSS